MRFLHAGRRPPHDTAERIPDADERRIRVELSGTFCRCTGYRGILNAVRGVVEARGSSPPSPCQDRRRAGCPACHVRAERRRGKPCGRRCSHNASSISRRLGWTLFEEELPPPRCGVDGVEDLRGYPCGHSHALLGADAERRRPDMVKGGMSAKPGLIPASFAGAAAIERDGAKVGVYRGAGSDLARAREPKVKATLDRGAEVTLANVVILSALRQPGRRARGARAPGTRRTLGCCWARLFCRQLQMPASWGDCWNRPSSTELNARMMTPVPMVLRSSSALDRP